MEWVQFGSLKYKFALEGILFFWVFGWDLKVDGPWSALSNGSSSQMPERRRGLSDAVQSIVQSGRILPGGILKEAACTKISRKESEFHGNGRVGCTLGDASAGDSEEARFRGTGLEENQAHHHSQSQRQEAPPPRLAGSRSPLPSDFSLFFLLSVISFL